MLNFRREIFNTTARLLLDTATDVFPLTAYCEHPECLQDSFYTYRYYTVDGRECPALYFDPLLVIGGDREINDPREPNYCTRCDDHHYLPGKEYTFLFLKPLGEQASRGEPRPAAGGAGAHQGQPRAVAPVRSISASTYDEIMHELPARVLHRGEGAPVPLHRAEPRAQRAVPPAREGPGSSTSTTCAEAFRLPARGRAGGRCESLDPVRAVPGVRAPDVARPAGRLLGQAARALARLRAASSTSHDPTTGANAETLGVFLVASDPDGMENLSAFYVINDDAELFWKVDSATWVTSTAEGETWIGTSSLAMPG